MSDELIQKILNRSVAEPEPTERSGDLTSRLYASAGVRPRLEPARVPEIGAHPTGNLPKLPWTERLGGGIRQGIDRSSLFALRVLTSNPLMDVKEDFSSAAQWIQRRLAGTLDPSPEFLVLTGQAKFQGPSREELIAQATGLSADERISIWNDHNHPLREDLIAWIQENFPIPETVTAEGSLTDSEARDQGFLRTSIEILEQQLKERVAQGQTEGVAGFVGEFIGNLPLDLLAGGPATVARRAVTPKAAEFAIRMKNHLIGIGVPTKLARTSSRLAYSAAREGVTAGVGGAAWEAMNTFAETGDVQDAAAAGATGLAFGAGLGVVGSIGFQTLARGWRKYRQAGREAVEAVSEVQDLVRLEQGKVVAPKNVVSEEAIDAAKELLRIPKAQTLTEGWVFSRYRERLLEVAQRHGSVSTPEALEDIQRLVLGADDLLNHLGSPAGSNQKIRSITDLLDQRLGDLTDAQRNVLFESPELFNQWLNANYLGQNLTVDVGTKKLVVQAGQGAGDALPPGTGLAVSGPSLAPTPGRVVTPSPTPGRPPTPRSESYTGPRLPHSLAGAKPRYKNSTLNFFSDIDKALYITGRRNKLSKRDAEYRTWLRENVGLTDAELDIAGQLVREHIRSRSRGDVATIGVPEFFTPERLQKLHREGGFLDFGAMNDTMLELAAKSIRARKHIPGRRTVGDFVSAVSRFMSNSSVQSVRLTGTEGAKALADQAEATLRMKAQVMGPMLPKVYDAQRALRSQGLTGFWHRAASTHQSVTDPGIRSSKTTLMRAMVDDDYLATLTPAQQRYIQLRRELNVQTAEAAGKAGLLRRVGRQERKLQIEHLEQLSDDELVEIFKSRRFGPNVPVPTINGMPNREVLIKELSKHRVFTPTPGGKVAPHEVSDEFIEFMLEGDRDFMRFVEYLAELNPIKGVSQERRTAGLLKQFDRMRSDENVRKLGIEFTRRVRELPSDVWIDGKHIRILDIDPFSSPMRQVERTAGRIAFASHYGQGLSFYERTGTGADRATRLAQLTREALDSKVEKTTWDRMIRDLAGTPYDQPLWTPGSPLSNLTRVWKNIVSMAAANLLTRAAFLQVPELFGNISAFGGVPNVLRAMKDIITHSADKDLIDWGIQQGIIGQDIMSWHFDPTSKLSLMTTLTRIYGSAMVRAFMVKPAWQFQEQVAFLTGHYMAERMRNQTMRPGHLSTANAMMRHVLGFTDEQAERIVMGKGTPEEYTDFVRRFTRRTNVTTLSSQAEKAQIGGYRLWQANFRLTGYSLMKAQSFTRTFGGVFEDMFKWADNPNPEAWKKFIGSVKVFARYHTGNALQGAATIGILALLQEGLTGAEARLREATGWGDFTPTERRKAMARFWADSYMSAQFGPLLWAAIRVNATQSFDTLWKSPLSIVVTENLLSYIGGWGAYERTGWLDGRGWIDNTIRWIDNSTAISRAVKRWVVVTGLVEGDAELEQARRELWKYRRQVLKITGRFERGKAVTEEQLRDQEFRLQLRRAYEHLTLKGPLTPSREERVQNFIDDAILATGKGYESAKQSLNARRLLKLPGMTQEQYDDFYFYLRARGMEHLWEKLEQHDRLLQLWIETMVEPMIMK